MKLQKSDSPIKMSDAESVSPSSTLKKNAEDRRMLPSKDDDNHGKRRPEVTNQAVHSAGENTNRQKKPNERNLDAVADSPQGLRHSSVITQQNLNATTASSSFKAETSSKQQQQPVKIIVVDTSLEDTSNNANRLNMVAETSTGQTSQGPARTKSMGTERDAKAQQQSNKGGSKSKEQDALDSAYQSEAATSPTSDSNAVVPNHVGQTLDNMLTAGFALNEVNKGPNVRSHYEAKKTVVREVTTTKTVIGSRGEVDGPAESKSQQRAAITSVVKAQSQGMAGKPTVTSAVKTSTEAKLIEDGKIVSQQKSSETRHNKSENAPKAITNQEYSNRAPSEPRRNYLSDSDDDITQTKLRHTHGSGDMPVIEAELRDPNPRGDWREANLSPTDGHNEVFTFSPNFDAKFSPLHIDANHSDSRNYSRSYSPGSYYSSVSGRAHSGASSPVHRERLNSRSTTDSRVIPLRSLKVDAQRREVSTHPSQAAPLHQVNLLNSQQRHAQAMYEMSSHMTDSQAPLTRSHSNSAYDRITTATGYPLRTAAMPARNGAYYGDPPLTLSSTQPRRFLRVDESRSGMIPRYRSQDIAVRNSMDEADTGLRRRARSTLTMGRLQSDPTYRQDYVDISLSDPDLSRNPGGRFSAQRVIERRGFDQHPDMLHKQRGYHLSRHQSMGSSKSDIGAPTAVDPQLQDISRAGKDYHVTLKLNSTLSGPTSPRGTLQSRTVEERHELMSKSPRGMRSHYNEGMAPGDRATIIRTGSMSAHPSPSVTHLQFQQHHGADINTLDVTDSAATLNSYRSPAGSNKFTARVGNHGDDTNNNEIRIETDSKYLIKSVNKTASSPRDQQVHLIADVTSDDTDVDSLGVHRSTAYWKVSGSSSQQHLQQPLTVNTGPALTASFGPRQNGQEPRFSMMINQTMTMDYAPTDDSQPSPVDEFNRPQRTGPVNAPGKRKPKRDSPDMPVDETAGRQRNRPNQAPGKPRRDDPVDEDMAPHRNSPVHAPNKQNPKKKQRPVNEDMIQATRSVKKESKFYSAPFDESDESEPSEIDEFDRPQRTGPVGRPRRNGPQEAEEDFIKPTRDPRREMPGSPSDVDYFSPDEDQDGRDSDESDMPKIVRGSILIKNTIDTTGGPKVIDIVEDESDDEVNVEDNTNLFHGQYFQSRENPMYSSQEDLREIETTVTTSVHPSKRRDPKFTEIFDKKTTSHSRSQPKVNGYDNEDYEHEIKVTRGE